jgi:fructokinase
MPRIFTFGETVYDIIFKDGQPKAAKPGGSTLNTSVSLGRLGLNVNFVSDLGMDIIGDTILSFLGQNGVAVESVERYVNHKTAIAIAFLDDNNDAFYTFYKDYPDNRLSNLKLTFGEGDIIMFGSFFAITENLRPVLHKFLKQAQEAGCIIIYDPNFRKAHLHELEKLKPFILENIAISDLVRGSNEDFNHIFGVDNPVDAYNLLNGLGCNNMIYTANKEEVTMVSDGNYVSGKVPQIVPISTIGAGDSFNAGLLWSLAKHQLKKSDLQMLSEEFMRETISNGSSFAANVSMSYDNYISLEFALAMRNKAS